MNITSGVAQLKKEERQRIQEIAALFEVAWSKVENKSQAANLEKYLPPANDPLRSRVLQELIKVDLEFRWRRGQAIGLEAYLKKFIDLGSSRTLSPLLIYEEYRVRQMFGDKPDIDTYQNRFPHQYDELKQLLSEQPFQDQLGQQHSTPSIQQQKTPTEVGVGQGANYLDIGGGYKLIKRIGTGSFGDVWQAEAPGGVPAAIKIIMRPFDHDESKRELKSLELIKRLNHPFLLKTHSYFPMQDRLIIAMELADGSLRDQLKRYQKEGQQGFPLDELIVYIREAAEALDFLHEEEVLHRDIKPDNILIHRKHAKVADFGMAKMLGTQRSITATGAGTPAYMAPEMWRNKVHPNSDQYSLAVSYAEMRLGRPIYSGQNMIDIMVDHLENRPDLDGLSEDEQEVLLRALSKSPNERFDSCSTFTHLLKKAVESELEDSDLDWSSKAPSSPSSPDLGGKSGKKLNRPATSPALGTQPDFPLPEKVSAGRTGRKPSEIPDLIETVSGPQEPSVPEPMPPDDDEGETLMLQAPPKRQSASSWKQPHAAVSARPANEPGFLNRVIQRVKGFFSPNRR